MQILKYNSKLHKVKIQELWDQNRYKIQVGIDYLHFIFHTKGRGMLMIILFLTHIILSTILSSLIPELLPVESLQLLGAEILICTLYIVYIVPNKLKPKFQEQTQQEKKELQELLDNQKTQSLYIVQQKDLLQAVFNIEQFTQKQLVEQITKFREQKIKNKKFKNNNEKNTDNNILISCIAIQQLPFKELENQKLIVKEIVEFCNKKFSNPQIYLEMPNTNIIEFQAFIDNHNFEVECQKSYDVKDKLFGTRLCILSQSHKLKEKPKEKEKKK